MSVCATLVIAATFFKRMSVLQVTPFTYADNWTFMSPNQRGHFKAFVDTLNFAHAIRMKIDIRNSWGWGTNDEMKKSGNMPTLLSQRIILTSSSNWPLKT